MSDTQTTMIHVRVDASLKIQASDVLAKMGLTVSDAVRVLLMRVVAEKAFPFQIQVPNTKPRQAVDELNQGGGERFPHTAAVFSDLEI